VSHARFFAPAAGAPGDVVKLPDDEAGHLTRVLRLSTGARVRAFNGRGAEFEAVVAAAGKDGVRLRIGEPCAPAAESRIAITLAQAVLKGDKMDDVVRDAVMMGVAALQPIITARTEITIAALARGHRHERWERIAVSSAKQCGRALVPPILVPCVFPLSPSSHLVNGLPSPILALVEPGASGRVPLGDLDAAVPGQATLVVGPEGGWTADEVQALSGLGSLVTIGGRTLRADAMALVALAALFTRWGEY
jgi:16S rRNA (uracil1498-N3)-methyltransferase